ncbi:MAG: toxic anion resistance protein, partial [Spirochaetaceae bacterium]|nr:toxic anion resistance protein [Spirochaetaceae bacterium]
AMEVIQRNNKELIRGVDRAKTVTVTALRTAVMVASALYNQKIVLQKIQMLNETTNNMIAATSKMLKEQGTDIHKQSIESALSVDTLKTAFQDVMEALDEISAFKQNALPAMQVTISQFRELADKGESAIQRIEKANAL